MQLREADDPQVANQTRSNHSRYKTVVLQNTSSSFSFSLCLFQASDFFFLLMDPLDIW
jgi:hypothetical protein